MKATYRAQTSSHRYGIRLALPEDREAICDLFHVVYGKQKSIEDFMWLYENNPSSRHRTWLAMDGETGHVVGARPVFPWRTKIGEEEILASQAGDAMTHPARRRQGIFSTLVRAAWSGLKKEGIPFSYSFPNPASLSVCHKVKISEEKTVGTHDIGNLCHWVRLLRWKAVLDRRLKKSSLSLPLGHLANLTTNLANQIWRVRTKSGLTVRAVDRFDERFDSLWGYLKIDFTVINVRNSVYLNWRYVDTPNKRHTALAVERGEDLLGYAVVELMTGADGSIEGYISDIFVIPETSAFGALMDGVLRWFWEKEAVQVRFTTLEGNPYRRMLRRWGFIRWPSRRPFAVHIHKSNPWDDLLLDAGKWYLTIGDWEVESVA